jgi:hypothetical protein
VQRRKVNAGTKAQHRGLCVPSEHAKILGCAHRQAIFTMGDTQCVHRFDRYGHGIRVIHRGGKYVAIGKRDGQTGL